MHGKRTPAPSALSELLLLQREINALVSRLASAQESHPHGEWTPSVDVFDRGGRVTVLVEVPGLAPEELSVLGRHGNLVVSGERRSARSEGMAFLCLERPAGRFSRTIPLDAPVDLARAEAELEQGVLTVTIPRVQERRGREIRIAVRRKGEP